jgi:hypothetical protein
MKITRPHNAEDNEYNIEMNRIVEHWAERYGEVIKEKEIYTYAVWILTETGREIIATKAAGCRSGYHNVRNFIYLKEIVDGKHKRIKKDEW